MLATKLMYTGFVFMMLLILPSLLKDVPVPDWFKTFVVVTGLSGIPLAFLSALWILWGVY